MGKVIINETDHKQKIVLVTSEVGVTGGFYDPEGEWHDFGSGEGGGSMELTAIYEEGSFVGIEESFKDIKDAVDGGKIVWVNKLISGESNIYYVTVLKPDDIEVELTGAYGGAISSLALLGSDETSPMEED